MSKHYRDDIETRHILVRDVAAQLTKIVEQSPNAELRVKDGSYGMLIDSVYWDGDNNAAVIEVVVNL